MKTIENLSCAAIDAEPRNFDFSEGFTELWETVYPSFDDWDEEKCKAYLADYSGRELDGDEDIDCLQDAVRDCMVEKETYCPMMNYVYPLPDLRMDEQEAQKLIEDTNCVIVLLREDCDNYPATPFLALSGGGMDLSWDICKAYMLLGLLPPVHFCRLPEFAGKKLDKTAKWIIDGCRKSLEIQKGWSESKIADLDNLENRMPKT